MENLFNEDEDTEKSDEKRLEFVIVMAVDKIAVREKLKKQTRDDTTNDREEEYYQNIKDKNKGIDIYYAVHFIQNFNANYLIEKDMDSVIYLIYLYLPLSLQQRRTILRRTDNVYFTSNIFTSIISDLRISFFRLKEKRIPASNNKLFLSLIINMVVHLIEHHVYYRDFFLFLYLNYKNNILSIESILEILDDINNQVNSIKKNQEKVFEHGEYLLFNSQCIFSFIKTFKKYDLIKELDGQLIYEELSFMLENQYENEMFYRNIIN